MPTISRESRSRILWSFGISFFLLLYLLFLRPPLDFPKGQMIIIPKGLTVDQSAKLLYADHIILSPTFFSILANLLSHEKIIAGPYLFDRPVGVFSIAFRTTKGDYNVDFIRLTFPEGMTVKEMAAECSKLLVGCKEEEFLALGKGKEGYLFPDTYYFLPGAEASEVVSAMEKNFETRIRTVQKVIDLFGKKEKDVITMASILEDEARTTEDRQIIAGILWKRLSIGMPLQVDAAFSYVTGTTTITANDLKINSPYNTYRNPGFPPTPIGNPGLQAIEAAVTPIKTPYFYYLSDRDGNFHYAQTLAEHVQNKLQYLK
jgi:UPF0755 protein